MTSLSTYDFSTCYTTEYLRDSRQEFEKWACTFPIFHAVVLLDSSN